MYKNGYFVEKDYPKYCQMIEELYEDHKNDEYGFIELPDICTRLAKIRKEEGNAAEAVCLYQKAKELLPERMRYTEFFGDINVMEWLVNDLYQLIEPDYSDLDTNKSICSNCHAHNRLYAPLSAIWNLIRSIGISTRRFCPDMRYPELAADISPASKNRPRSDLTQRR